MVDISQTYKNDGFEAAKELTEAVIDGGYAYQIGPVAFKPTWANGDQTFRTTRKGAVSYFVGGDEDYDDLGFAIGSAPDPVTGERSAWKDSWFDLSVRRFDGETAIVQGLLYTESEDGTVGYVDKTWGFQKDDLGNVRIVLHHSSSPYETVDEPKKIKNHTVNNRSFDIDNLITKKEVLAAQEGWTDALVAISQTYKDEGFDAAEELAGAVIDAAYGYQEGAVAFKPTWAYGDNTFRPTREGAVSYFVGGSDKYDDLGFAIGSTPDENGDRSSWANAWTENAVIRIDGDTATTMGWMYTEDEAGNVGYVDKTWTFQKGDDGVLRVVVHHSSKPYE
ncbi:hypothetical protein KR100_07460 [Synechococcus sp. KORDI-100]|nr:hypothetical protein KR100_07460 [Synechococcus sp. KORDI-100]